MQEAPQPGHPHQQGTEMPHHDDSVVQGLSGGRVAVMGHHCEQNDLNTSQKMGSKELSHAAFIRDGSPLIQGVSNEFGGHRGRITDVNKGEVAQKKIHGGSKCVTGGDGDHNEHVATNCDHIDDQKDYKENSVCLGSVRVLA